MKNHLIISLLILSVGLSQQLIPQITETYKNGNVKSIIYHKKTRNGIEKVKYEGYYDNGQKKSEITYKDGKKDGLQTVWYENGQKQTESIFKDGELVDLLGLWDEDGFEI